MAVLVEYQIDSGNWNSLDSLDCSSLPSDTGLLTGLMGAGLYTWRLTQAGLDIVQNNNVLIEFFYNLSNTGIPDVVFDKNSTNEKTLNLTSGTHYIRRKYSACAEDECSNNFDCLEGEKCVDGECVPCDEQQATHFQIRAEFEELVTLPDGSRVMYLLSSVYPIGSGVNNQIIQLSECNGVWYYPRIRFCDSVGSIKPYTGALSFYGYCNPDGSSAMWVNNFNATEDSHLLGQKAQMDAHFATPLSVPRILIEFIEPSGVIYDTDCSDVIPVEPPDIEPVEPPDDPEEPVEPVEPPDDPEEPVEPLPPTPPPQPQEGLCPCEEYIGLQIKRAADILYDGLILLKRELSVIGREIIVELWESRKQQYQLSMFLQNQQFQLLQAQNQRLFEIRQILDKMSDDVSVGLFDDDGNGLIDIVSTGLVDQNDKGLVKHVKDFVEQYEPVQIENEYRVQSRRTENFVEDQ